MGQFLAIIETGFRNSLGGIAQQNWKWGTSEISRVEVASRLRRCVPHLRWALFNKSELLLVFEDSHPSLESSLLVVTLNIETGFST